ncbi:D-amino-acid dehydrogenase [Pacificibacter maritimus]|uniref:D-amino-acid dehydrogenase n=1 Tax=Pacificibacter maritimus TaxID=762213 RepID=A0A3N4U3Q6_9RHOB|nr:FAD-dependent oxidoreductase [Pacificibacter maritimus]RPE62935.1 D-amino-acid dehydrogenase [Pacificibacter maritimus]
MTELAIFGAGFLGVSTAIALRMRGAQVVLIDKSDLGAGASFGNAGIIQSEALSPFPMPRDLPTILRTVLGLNPNVSLRFPSVMKSSQALAQYYFASTDAGVAHASKTYAGLIRQATQAHLDLAKLSGASELFHTGGYRMRFTSHDDFNAYSEAHAQIAQDHDLPYRILSSSEFAKAETGITDAGVGAFEWSGPLRVAKPQELLQSYFDYFKSIGGEMARGDACDLQPRGQGWRVPTSTGIMDVSKVVIATGAQTPEVLRGLDLSVPMIAKRGYHAVVQGGAALSVPLLDVEQGVVLSPQGADIRIHTGAELGGAGPRKNSPQLRRALKVAQRLFGVDPNPVSTWSGARPCMPDMLPVMGASTKHNGLWYNFGHGHQGLTLGPVSGRMIAEALLEDLPLPTSLSPARFSI